MQAGVKLTDIERLISQMYTDGAQTVLCRQNPNSDAQSRLETPGRQITTNCFVRAYFEFEHMYAQHMSEIPFLWLLADHTFNNGCLSDIPPSGGTNRNEALHKILHKNISRQRIGVQLALALLGISFYIWNEKRSNPDLKTAKVNRSIQSYYSSFFSTSTTPTTERFGISASEKRQLMDKNQGLGYCYDYSGDLDKVLSNNLENDKEESESEPESDAECLPHQSIST